MTNWWKLLLSIVLLLGGQKLSAQEESVYTVPVEWQRVELQKMIAQDVTRSIQSLVDPAKFLVHVTIQVNEAKTFGVAEKEKATVGEFPLAKLGINKESSAYKKAITSSHNNLFARLKLVSIDITLDASVTKTQEAQVGVLVSKVMKTYTEGAKVAVSRMNFLNLDDFARARNLEVARVNVEAAKSLASGLAESLTKGNEKIAEALGQGNEKIAQAIAATANIKLPDSKDVKQAPTTGMPASWQEILILFRIPLGIIIATLLLVVFISGFKSIENKKVALMASANQAAQAVGSAGRAVEAFEAAPSASETEDAEKVVAAQGAGVAVAGGRAAGDSGFDQFKKMSEQYAETAAYLIKTWVNMDTPQAREALAAMTKMIPVDVLVPVISQLDDSLKNRFKKASSEPIDADSIARADSFIIE
ncbi:MAG: hypothetical protein ABL958_02065, partial [Bdellovibrionia bacterium]